MTDLTIAGESFHVLIEGDETSPVLMVSNSLGTNLHMWDAQIADLTKHFRVIRYDSRGHGRSVVSPGPYSIAQLGRDALAILDALGIEKAHWLGLSKGGGIGQWLMINAPERIERAVLANTAAKFGNAETWNERITLVKAGGMAALIDGTLERWFGKAFRETNDEAIEPIRSMFLATSPEGYTASCAGLRDNDLREGLRGIEHPVLVIAGRDDLATPLAAGELIAKSIPNAKLVTLEARHLSNIEQTAAFTKAVIDFLTAKIPARRATVAKTLVPKTPVARATGRRPAGRRLAAVRGSVTEPITRRAPKSAASVAPKAPARKTAEVSEPATKPAPTARKAAKASAASKTKAAPAKAPASKAPKAAAKATATKAAAAKGKTLKAAAPAKATRTAAKPAAKPTRATAAKAKPAKAPAKATATKSAAAKPAPAKSTRAKAAPKAAPRTKAATKAPAPAKAARAAKPAAKPRAAAKAPRRPTGRRK